MPQTPGDLAPMDRAAFAIVFHEECEAAGPDGLVSEVVARAMARVRAWKSGQAPA